jgi:drug/metabolite transporter (DMT)-like permease
MFGTSAVMLIFGSMTLAQPPHVALSISTTISVTYIGAATAAVFLLRSLALQTLAPATVTVCHNLVPVGAILFAHLYLGEPVGMNTLLGGAAILGGVELVRRASNVPSSVSGCRMGSIVNTVMSKT